MYKIGKCEDLLKSLESNSIDLIVTDPPYGLKFMGLNWDKALPSEEALSECVRVLKPGAFGFFMCAPRQDLLSRMIIRLEDAGFKTGFSSIYWCQAQGFPKALDVSKIVDKRNGRDQETYKQLADYLKESRIAKGYSMNGIDKILGTNTAYSWWEGRASGIQIPRKEYYLKLKSILDLDNRFDELIEREEAEREIIGKGECGDPVKWHAGGESKKLEYDITAPATTQAKSLTGAYAGFQPKPATEVIIVVMKPLSMKSYVDQALNNGKGVTWMSDCKIPYKTDKDKESARFGSQMDIKGGNLRNSNGVLAKNVLSSETGRFPANILCSDDILNDGKITKYAGGPANQEKTNSTDIYKFTDHKRGVHPGDSGSFSRYFDLDAWYTEKIKDLPESIQKTFPYLIVPKPSKKETTLNGKIENKHPTKKPLKLMMYLITMGSRPGDIILDPYEVQE